MGNFTKHPMLDKLDRPDPRVGHEIRDVATFESLRSVAMDDDEAFQRVLERGADINVRDDDGDTLLHRACAWGTRGKVKMLLEAGADVNAYNIHGSTPLHTVCSNGNIAKVRLLLEAGADVNVKDVEGRTPWDRVTVRYPHGSETREEILDLFRQYAPEQVMEAYCTVGLGA